MSEHADATDQADAEGDVDRSGTASTSAETDLDLVHLGNATGFAVVLALYATWITADLVSRWIVFPVVAVLGGYLLYRQESEHDQWVFFGYRLAILVLVTPLFMILSDALSADAYGVGPLSIVFMYANFIMFFVFAIVAGLIAYVTYRYDDGGKLLLRWR